MSSKVQAVVGMEVHAELLTESKMFCGCGTQFGAPANTHCCPVCLGLPGSLPVPNRAAIEHVLRTALALNCTINRRCLFHRKNYFYPDLPKAYQISQYDVPIGENGWLDILVNGETKRVRIRRVHLEEDTGKLLHVERDSTFVDYNRSGVPLMEIVTEADIEGKTDPVTGDEIYSAADLAREYLIALRRVLLYINASDGRMEQGSLRCEPNISVRPSDTKELNDKSELKNLNSFRVVQLGIEYEEHRQALGWWKARGVDISGFSWERLARLGGPYSSAVRLTIDRNDLEICQETRRWSEEDKKTLRMRTKEYAHDYRYFPEPDMVPIAFDEEWLARVQASLPELPETRLERYVGAFGLSAYDAGLLVDERAISDYFDKAVASYGGDAKKIANWMQSDWLRLFNAAHRDWASVKVEPQHLGELVKLLDDGKITGKIAKELFEAMWGTGKAPAALVKEQGIEVVGSEDALLPIVDQVIAANERLVAAIVEKGEHGKINALMGMVLKETKGAAKPDVVQKLIRKQLGIE